MNNKFVEDILRRHFPNHSGYAMNDKSVVVGIPKADSMFFVEGTAHPLLQSFSSFKRNGMSLFTEWEKHEANEETDVLVFSFEAFSHSQSFLDMLEIKDLLEDKNDANDPDWEIKFKSGKTVKAKGNNSKEAIANAMGDNDGEEIDSVDMIDENVAYLKRLFNY